MDSSYKTALNVMQQSEGFRKALIVLEDHTNSTLTMPQIIAAAQAQAAFLQAASGFAIAGSIECLTALIDKVENKMDDDAELIRRTVKALRFAECYGAGDIRIGRMSGRYPNPSYIAMDFAECEKHIFVKEARNE